MRLKRLVLEALPSPIAAAGAFQPDVILLDIGLPKMNGYEAARRIRHSLSRDVAVNQLDSAMRRFLAALDHRTGASAKG